MEKIIPIIHANRARCNSKHYLSMCRVQLGRQDPQGPEERMENEDPLVPLATRETVGSRERRETRGYSALLEHRDPKDHQ